MLNPFQRCLFGTLLIASGAWAGAPPLTYALNQVLAAQASYQSSEPEEAAAHTRAALDLVEILRREPTGRLPLESAAAELGASLEQNEKGSYDQAATALERAVAAMKAESERLNPR